MDESTLDNETFQVLLGGINVEGKISYESRIAKFSLTAIGTFGLTYVLTTEFLVYSPNLISFIPNVLMFGSLGVGLYIIITYLIDNKIRSLVHAIIYEITRKNLEK